jgi:hypothetical protein
MTLEPFVELVAGRVPTANDVESAAHALQLSVPDLCDEVSRAVALRFVDGRYSFEVADTIMNNLFAFAYAVQGGGLPKLAWGVYQAFDEGEYEHAGDPPELQGAARTRRLLAGMAVLGLPPAPPEEPAWRLVHRNGARARAVAIAEQVLGGQLSPTVGALELCRLRASVEVPANDSDFEVFS